MRIYICLILFFLPTSIARFLIPRKYGRIERGAKIGFSFILVDRIYMKHDSRIGHLNYIAIESLSIGESAFIAHMNIIRGMFSLKMMANSWINHSNKISAIRNIKYHDVYLTLGCNAKIGVSHLIDMTDSVTIGAGSMLAGSGSQIWSHSFIFAGDGREVRVDAPVNLGSNIYVGSRCIINSGVTIDDSITIGSGAVVSKSLVEKGLYVSQALRKIDYDPVSRIEQLGECVAPNIYRK